MAAGQNTGGKCGRNRSEVRDMLYVVRTIKYNSQWQIVREAYVTRVAIVIHVVIVCVICVVAQYKQMLCQGSISIRLVSFHSLRSVTIEFSLRFRFRFDFFWVRNIFNVATEHVKQIKATRAAIADAQRVRERGEGEREEWVLPLTMEIMITNCVGFRS